MQPLTTFALIGLLCAAAASSRAAVPDVERDRWGRPVRDAHGAPLLYTAEQEPAPPDAAAEPDAVPAAAGPAQAAEEPDASSSFAMRPLWWRHVYGTGIGDTGLVVTDLDGDGRKEIVAGSSSGGGFWANDSWLVARHAGTAPERYDIVFRSPIGSSSLTNLRVAQIDADPTPEVLASVGPQVLIYDGATLTLQQTVNTATSSLAALVVADVDNDTALELVACSASTLYVYGLGGSLEYSTAVPCIDLAVGQVDNDPAPEIVIGNGENPGYVIDGVSHALEWTNNFGFGVHVRLGDLDGDGRQEVVAGSAWYQIRVYDVDLMSLEASITVDLDLATLELYDVEGDGPLEIVYADGQWGDVHVLDGATYAQKWAIPNPEHGVTGTAFGDPDGDGTLEILWGAGYTSTGPDYLYVASVPTRLVEWQSTDINGPFLALEVAPTVGTARRAVIGAAFESESGYGDGLYFFHYVNGQAFYQSPELTGSNWTGMTRVRAAQLDADSPYEVVVASSNTYSGAVICRDTLSHLEQWRATLPSGLSVASMAIGDVDLDGQLEVVVGVRVEHTGAPGVFVYVFNGANGALEWTSPSLTSGFVDLHWLRLAQVDADPQPEIVVGATNGQVYVLDRVEPSTRSLGPQQVSALETFDLDGNGAAELFVGTTGGAVRRIDAGTGAVLQTLFTEGAAVSGLAVGDLDSDGVPDYASASGNVVRVRSGSGFALLWASGVLAQPPSVVGERDSLLLAQVDGLGAPELVVNVGRAGFVVLTSAP